MPEGIKGWPKKSLKINEVLSALDAGARIVFQWHTCCVRVVYPDHSWARVDGRSYQAFLAFHARRYAVKYEGEGSTLQITRRKKEPK